MEQTSEENRRPLKSRGSKWAVSLSTALLKRNVKPNQVSVASAAAGALTMLAFWLSAAVESPVARGALLIVAALGMQLRLLCNLFDGMLAVEGGLRSPSGEIYNDLPDRVSDSFIFIGAGLASAHQAVLGVSGMTLGWLAVVLAIMTAYIRVLGAAAGTGHFFIGPMAKQHRMAVMTGTCVIQAVLCFSHSTIELIPWALLVIVVGSTYTCVRRTRKIVNTLEQRG